MQTFQADRRQPQDDNRAARRSDVQAAPPDLLHRGPLVPLIVASVFFMETLDATIITTALPAMAHSFATTPTALSLGITAYMLALAACLPIGGWAADRFGTRTVLASAIIVFVAASILCGISQELGPFIAARVLQGASAALMTPVGRLIVLRDTPKSNMLNAITTITWPGLLAPVVGPALGGLFVEYLSWRWIFFVNVPIGALGLLLVMRFIPDLRRPNHGAFDWRGLLLTSTALASLLLSTDLLAQSGIRWMLALPLLLVALIIGRAALRHAATATDPLVSAAPFRTPTFLISTVSGGGLFRLTTGAMPFLLPLFFQLGFGMSPLDAGLMVLAYAAGNLGMKAIAKPVLRRFGFRTTLVCNGLLAAAAIAACAMLTPQTPLLIELPVLFIAGCLRSMQLTGLATLAYVDIEAREQSAATTLASMLQPIAGSLGVALCAVALSLSSVMRGGEPPGLLDFQLVLVCAAAIAAASVIPFLRLPRDIGAEATGRPSGTGLVKAANS